MMPNDVSPSDSGRRISLRVAGEARQSALYRSYRASDIPGEGIKIENLGEGTLQAVVSVSGAPVTPEPAAERGFKIERTYHTMEGDAVNPAKVAQNTRLVVVLKITEPAPQYGRLIVADYLPAGFEIDNPNLVSSGETSTLLCRLRSVSFATSTATLVRMAAIASRYVLSSPSEAGKATIAASL